MVLLKTTLALLSVVASLSPAVDARSSLTRRRCRANHGTAGGGGGNGGAINVGFPTSSPDDGPERPTSSTDDGDSKPTASPGKPNKPSPSGCFPSAGFNTPDSPKGISVDDWWCPRSSEYAFLGFSYAVDACPSQSAMTDQFKQMKNEHNARYVRLYGACDRKGFHSDVVDAAYEAGVGVYALVWFGFTGGNQWKNRLEDIVDAVESNPRAPYVIRNVAIGSEALFDNAISAGNLVSQLNQLKNRVGNKGIEVSTSEMAYKLQDAPDVTKTCDNVQLNVLPFFSGKATTGSNARSNFMGDLTRMANATNNKKKIVATQTGWPSNDSVWKANSRSAVASVASEKAYFDLLDDLCDDLKDGPVGGFGWFAHIWSDNGLPGWGIINSNGEPKFNFKPRTKC